jgi:hypothetical protein
MNGRGEKQSRSRLYEVDGGEAVDFGRVASYEEVPEEEAEFHDVEFVANSDQEVKYAIFIPAGQEDPLLVATNGNIFITDDNNTTIERV